MVEHATVSFRIELHVTLGSRYNFVKLLVITYTFQSQKNSRLYEIWCLFHFGLNFGSSISQVYFLSCHVLR